MIEKQNERLVYLEILEEGKLTIHDNCLSFNNYTLIALSINEPAYFGSVASFDYQLNKPIPKDCYQETILFGEIYKNRD